MTLDYKTERKEYLSPYEAGDILVFRNPKGGGNAKWLMLAILVVLILVGICKAEQTNIPPINNRSITGSPLLTDLEQHCDKSTYYFDLTTRAHETTHDCNAKMAILSKLEGHGQAMYCYNNIVFIVREKGYTTSALAKLIPPNYRIGSCYKDYIIDSVRTFPAYENRPLQLCDEWCAYVNGCIAADGMIVWQTKVDYSFNHACQLGIFVSYYNQMAKDKDVQEFIDFQTKRMATIKCPLSVVTKKWYDAYLLVSKGQSTGRIKPIE